MGLGWLLCIASAHDKVLEAVMATLVAKSIETCSWWDVTEPEGRGVFSSDVLL